MRAVYYGIAVMVVISVVSWGVTTFLSTSTGESLKSNYDSVRID